MESRRIDLLTDGPPGAERTLVLAHGAGAAMDTPFMAGIARSVAGEGIRVVRFEFPYMERRRADGKRRPPDRLPALSRRWLDVIARLGGPERLVIGGKSMGGRVASMLADEAGVRGLVCLGYPFHPPGKPDRLRTGHLERLRTPALIVQGTRDALGNREEIEDYALSPKIRLLFLEDGDHSFKPRVRSGLTHEQHLETAAAGVAAFVASF
jgi:predicted alpha/beta-hydrolase family hydrolase